MYIAHKHETLSSASQQRQELRLNNNKHPVLLLLQLI